MSARTSCEETSSYERLQVGKWYAEIEDDGRFGVLYQCIEIGSDSCGDYFVMVDESDDSEPRYINERSATTRYWALQL